MTSSRVMLPECLMFFSFFLSRRGSVKRTGQNRRTTEGLVGSTLEGFDDKRRGGRNNIDFCLSVLDCKLDGYP